MKINILTIFPNFFDSWMNEGIVKRAVDKGQLEINIIDIREYTENKHKKVDDYPFGGGEGMLMTAQPLFSAIESNALENTHVIFPSPSGKILNQDKANELKDIKEITFVAGRYEGVDQRFIDTHVDELISIGEYILTGGEIPIEVIIESTIRLIPGVLGNQLSFENESYSDFLLEHPHYTRPANFRGLEVPEVLLNGNHKLIEEWKLKEMLSNTYINRHDLFLKYKDKYYHDKKIKRLIDEVEGQNER